MSFVLTILLFSLDPIPAVIELRLCKLFKFDILLDTLLDNSEFSIIESKIVSLLGVDFNVGVSFDILSDKLSGASPSTEWFLNSDLDFSLLVVLKFKPPPLSQSESSTSKNRNYSSLDLLCTG